MKNVHELGIDLNLLPVLVAIMRERSVTKAARALGTSQSAVSHALGRLRRAIGDVLFVRNGHAVEPTQRALELFEVVAPALSSIEQEIRLARRFDPATARTTFRIGLSDDLQISVLPLLLARLRIEAPLVSLIVRTTDYLKASDMLGKADVSLVVGYLSQLPAQAKVRTLRTAGYRVLRAKRGPITLDAYCAAEHVLVTFAGDLRGYIDESLEALGRARTVALSLPQFGSLPYVLQGTDYWATVPDHIARSFEAAHGLRSDSPPFASPLFDVSMAWRAEVAMDASEAWLRAVVRDCVGSASRHRGGKS